MYVRVKGLRIFSDIQGYAVRNVKKQKEINKKNVFKHGRNYWQKKLIFASHVTSKKFVVTKDIIIGFQKHDVRSSTYFCTF